MSNSQVTFYDLPSRPPCKTWSLNPWKTRLYLNYKGIPYKTTWIEYPDIKPTLSKHVQPNGEDAFAPYTIPTIILPDGTYMQESLEIAKKLEETFPEPKLKIETPHLEKVSSIIPKIMAAAGPRFLYLVPDRLLNEESKEWWWPDREQRIGKPVKDLYDSVSDDSVSQGAAEPVKAVTQLLKENSDGPFFEGKHVTYVDFVWVGLLKFFQRIGQDVFDLVIQEDKDVHLALMAACEPWLKRDDH